MDQLPATFVQDFHDEASVRKMKYVSFGNTGLMVSKISLGTGTLSKFYGDLGEKEGVKAVHLALKKGINYIDTAPYYGQGRSEEILGQALKDVPRRAYYVATKVGRYELEYDKMFDFCAQKTRASVEKSLALLGVECIDVVQIHDVEFAADLNVIWNETLPTLEALKAEGKLKYIGVSAYPMDPLKKVISGAPGRFDTVLCYCRNTLIDDSLKEYLPFFKVNNLAVICASGHGMGLLTNAGPQPWHPAQDQTKQVCREAAEYCKQHGVELGKLAMYHFIQLDGPSTFLSGMQSEELVDINLAAFFNGLTPKEREVLDYLKDRVFPKVTAKNWEGIEVERYWSAIKSTSN
nr:L-galactose dehydrogenase [Aedes albopictus]